METRARNRLLLVLFIGVLMGALDIAIVGPALPSLQTHFGVSERAIAWVFTLYVLSNLIGTPLMAKLSDAFGRRAIYALDVILFALGSLVVALSPNFAILLLGRALQGIGAGGIFPVASAVIGDTFPPEKRGSALGLIGAVFGIAFLIGPILGGVLLTFGWRWLFVINLPIAAVILAFGLPLLPATRSGERRSFDWQGMVVLGILLASLTYGINQIDTSRFIVSLSSLSVWPLLLLALVLLPTFQRLERRAEDPILRLKLFASRQVATVGILATGAGFSEAALVFVPSFLVAAFGVTSSQSSFMLLPAVLAMAVGAPLAGRGLDRYGSRVVVAVGAFTLVVGMAIVGLITINLLVFYLAAILIGLGLSSLLGAPLRYIMLNEAPINDRAAAQGAITLFRSVGRLLGSAAVGAVAASRGGGESGYSAAYLLVAVVAFVLFITSFGLKGRVQEMATVRQDEKVSRIKSA